MLTTDSSLDDRLDRALGLLRNRSVLFVDIPATKEERALIAREVAASGQLVRVRDHGNSVTLLSWTAAACLM